MIKFLIRIYKEYKSRKPPKFRVAARVKRTKFYGLQGWGITDLGTANFSDPCYAAKFVKKLQPSTKKEASEEVLIDLFIDGKLIFKDATCSAVYYHLLYINILG